MFFCFPFLQKSNHVSFNIKIWNATQLALGDGKTKQYKTFSIQMITPGCNASTVYMELYDFMKAEKRKTNVNKTEIQRLHKNFLEEKEN